MRSQSLKTIGYWITTAIVAFLFIAGGAIDAAHPPDAVAFIAHLGYPVYFMVLLGTWKVLGGFAVLAPGLPRLKEWAYAGIIFDLTGAAVSHASSGDAPHVFLFPLLVAVVAMASWALRPQSRRLGTIVQARDDGRTAGLSNVAV